jgi:NAD(P)-dependent dehydrogenase (short-subunit alcohol dehydrogenase family)
MQITGKNIWLTGATSTLGQELARQLAAAGNHVIASGRDETALQRLVEDTGGAISRLALDLADPASMQRAAARLGIITDRLDLLIIGAQRCESIDPNHFNPTAIQRVMEVNFAGAMATVATALPLMRRAPRPHIIFISSLKTLLPAPRAEAYGSSKAALEYFARSLALDLASAGFSISIVRPGPLQKTVSQSGRPPAQAGIAVQEAASRIIAGVAKRRRTIDFPRRVSWPLKLMRYIPPSYRRRATARWANRM